MSNIRLCIRYGLQNGSRRDIMKVEEEIIKTLRSTYQFRSSEPLGPHSNHPHPVHREALFEPINGEYKLNTRLETRLSSIKGLQILDLRSYIPLWQKQI